MSVLPANDKAAYTTQIHQELQSVVFIHAKKLSDVPFGASDILLENSNLQHLSRYSYI